MKFYQRVASVIFCIMYTAAIFGSEKTDLPYVPKDICNLIDEFGGNKDVRYEETARVKPYPPFLRKLISFLRISEYDGYGGKTRPVQKYGVCLFFGISLWFGCFVRKFLVISKRIGLTKGFGFGKMLMASSVIFFLSLFEVKIKTKIEKLSRSYTCIRTEFSPRFMCLQKEKDCLFIRSNLPAVSCGSSIFYPEEYRCLSDMNFESRKLEPCYPIEARSGFRKSTKGGWVFIVKNGKLNIYQSETDHDKLIRLQAIENVTDLAVFDDYKIMVTTGKDGIRKWKLQEPKKIQTILEELKKEKELEEVE